VNLPDIHKPDQILPYLAAAIDLGSNSFHVTLIDMRPTLSGEPYVVLSRAGEKIQLAAGLDEANVLSQEAIERGLDCLRRLVPKLAQVAPEHCHVMATNTLRVAQNASAFINPASAILGVQVKVVTGEEEAELIFRGVIGELAYSRYKNADKLVIDIGGGSTELIQGCQSPQIVNSYPMGCVAFSRKYFPNRKITAKAMQQAVEAAQDIIASKLEIYQQQGWQVCIGSSGTVKALACLSGLKEDGTYYLNQASMANIERQLLAFDNLDEVKIDGLRPDRGEVLPAGYAILKGIMQSLQLDRIYFSTGALREGVLLRSLRGA
jgi:exopolyphosphatase/guanosine-5'-triphosphate,3'-diphosphate pyrophosphatase